MLHVGKNNSFTAFQGPHVIAWNAAQRQQWEALLLKHLVKSVLFCLTLSQGVSLGWAGPLDDGSAAYERGDYDTALQMWLPLAQENDPRAQFNVGLMYGQGRGVPQNYVKSVEWFRKAAERGLPNAQAFLGEAYRSGVGVARDYGKAALWLENAARGGDTLGMMKLAQLYAEGNGVAKDIKQANAWMMAAAGAGNAQAQYFIGLLFENNGLTTETIDPESVRQDTKQENLKTAYSYYFASAAQGHKKAQDKVDSLRAQLSTAEIEQAEKEAAKYSSDNLIILGPRAQ